LGWVGAPTVVVLGGDGAEWIWKRATLFVRRCEILDFWHAWEHAWGFARLRYGEGSAPADRWVHEIAEDLRAGKAPEVIARLQRVRPKTPEWRESLPALQPPGTLDLSARLGDTLAALEQLPAASARFRKNLPRRAHPTLAPLDLTVRQSLLPAEAYNMVPGRDPQTG
jgi:hypothetical protein